ncbi:MAG: hypothetical protein HY908_04075 [Myxococcales bacterium]|nr:hypothetical protein [Myxococcales bacterium]
MKFPRPLFQILSGHFDPHPEGVHPCAQGYVRTGARAFETGAVRVSEALVLALGLARDRTTIARTAERGSGAGRLLGRYGYPTGLCCHGLAQGAAELGHFLRAQWGAPFVATGAALRDGAPPELAGVTGVVAFLGIRAGGERVRAQGHVDLWDKTRCLGQAYFGADELCFWRLD